MRVIFLAGVAVAAGACSPAAREAPPRAVSIAVEEEEEWRSAASGSDAAALDGLAALRQRLAAAVRPRFASRLSAEKDLLEPSAALARAAPAPGPYRCRWIRLGRPALFASSRPAFCYVGVEGNGLSLATETAGLRLGGYLWEEKGGRRLVFLGASVAPRAKVPPPYGEDPARDLAGLLERVGEFRYRLTLPGRGQPEQMHVVELVAAPRE